MGDLQREPERPKRNRAWGDREKPMGVETQGTREEKVRNRMGKGLPWRPSGQDPALPKQKVRASTCGWGTKIPHAVWLSQWARKKDDRDRMRDMERTTQMENQCDSDRVRWGDREIQRERLRVCVTRMADPTSLEGHLNTCLLGHPPPAPPTDPTGQVCGNGYICHIMQMSHEYAAVHCLALPPPPSAQAWPLGPRAAQSP